MYSLRVPRVAASIAKAIDGFNPGLCCLTPLAYGLKLAVTDPREPLYGKRFRIESISRVEQEIAHVFVRRENGIVLRVPLRATSLSTLVDDAPKAKLCWPSVQEFLSLVKEYELCPPQSPNEPTKSGRSSKKKSDKKS